MIAATQNADASTGPIVAIATLNFDGVDAWAMFAVMQTLVFSLSFILACVKRFDDIASPFMEPAVAV